MDQERDERYSTLETAYDLLAKELAALKSEMSDQQTQIKLAIFDKIPMPVWACDRNCKIVFWNEPAARLYGYSHGEAVGKDFVELFVNPPERAKARIDCCDIIDNNKHIRNMADDIDRYGNTRKLVTQCFPLYNVGVHNGLQVEISYEVQDIDRLEKDLLKLQSDYRDEQQKKEELQRRLLISTRQRAEGALDNVVQAEREALRASESAITQAELQRDPDKAMIAAARVSLGQKRDRLFTWETEKRKLINSDLSVEELETLISRLENREGLNV